MTLILKAGTLLMLLFVRATKKYILLRLGVWIWKEQIFIGNTYNTERFDLMENLTVSIFSDRGKKKAIE